MVQLPSEVTFLLQENLDREQYVYLAKLAERHEEMATFMKKLVLRCLQPPNEITVEERCLLSVAFKIILLEQKEVIRKNDDQVSLAKDYRSVLESELSQVCAGILELLDAHLVPTATASESKVFYLKMKGDYHRYLRRLRLARGGKRRWRILCLHIRRLRRSRWRIWNPLIQ